VAVNWKAGLPPGKEEKMAQFQKVRATRNVDYVTAGETYAVEREKRFSYFRNVRTGGATSVPNWMFDQSVRNGTFVVEP